MIANTLNIKVVPQARDRGYMVLCGFTSKLTQATAASYSTCSPSSRRALNDTIAALQRKHSASDVLDITQPNVQKQLTKLFGEVEEPETV